MSRGAWLGRERIVLEVCDSTNDEAAAAAARGAAHGTVVIARAQRAGRGRLGRAWYSPAGENLYLSCLLRPECRPDEAPPLTLAAGLGTVDAVDSLLPAGRVATLKWPNDVLVRGRKLAGILTEMSTRGKRVEHVVVGIGVNLLTERYPPELADRATSLRLAGASVEPDRFADLLLAHLEPAFDRFFAGGVAAIAEPWLERAGLAGTESRRVAVTTAAGRFEGRAVGLDAGGRLQVRGDDGAIRTVIAGDVVEVAADAG